MVVTVQLTLDGGESVVDAVKAIVDAAGESASPASADTTWVLGLICDQKGNLVDVRFRRSCIVSVPGSGRGDSGCSAFVCDESFKSPAFICDES